MSCKSKGIRRARAATTTTHTYIPMMMKSSHGMIGASARIREAGSDLIFDECIAYLQSEQACHVEGLFMLQPSLTNVRFLQQKVLSGKSLVAVNEGEGNEKMKEDFDIIPDSERKASFDEKESEAGDDKAVGAAAEAKKEDGGLHHYHEDENQGDGYRDDDDEEDDEEYDWDDYSPHEVATLLLQHLQVRSQPLIPFDLYEPLLQCCSHGPSSSLSSSHQQWTSRSVDENRRPPPPQGGLTIHDDDDDDDDDDDVRGLYDDDDDDDYDGGFRESRVIIVLDRLVEVLSRLPSRNLNQLENLLIILRRVAMEPTGGEEIHGPTIAGLGAVLGPLLARPEGSAHMSIRHAKDLTKLAALGSSMIQHSPDLFTTRGRLSPPPGPLGVTTAPAFTPPPSLSIDAGRSPCASPRNTLLNVVPSINTSTTTPSPISISPRAAIMTAISPSSSASSASPSSSKCCSNQHHQHHHHPCMPQSHHPPAPIQHSQQTRAVLQQILLPNTVAKLFPRDQQQQQEEEKDEGKAGAVDAYGLSSLASDLVSYRCGRSISHPQNNASLLLLQNRMDPSCLLLTSFLADLSLKSIISPRDGEGSVIGHHSRTSSFASVLSSHSSSEATSAACHHQCAAGSACLGSRQRKRMVGACRALREQINRFEESFVLEHGHMPKGVERAAMASTYCQYRAWKRAIRDDAAKSIQRVFRGARVRANVHYNGGTIRDMTRQRKNTNNNDEEDLLYHANAVVDDEHDQKEEEIYPEFDGREAPTAATSKLSGTTIASSSSSSSSSLPMACDLQFLLEKKKDIKARLKKFDTDFMAKYHRAPTKEDKEPIRRHYERYNRLKNRIQALEKEQEREGGGSSSTSKGTATSLMKKASSLSSEHHPTAEGAQAVYNKSGGGGGSRHHEEKNEHLGTTGGWGEHYYSTLNAPGGGGGGTGTFSSSYPSSSSSSSPIASMKKVAYIGDEGQQGRIQKPRPSSKHTDWKKGEETEAAEERRGGNQEEEEEEEQAEEVEEEDLEAVGEATIAMIIRSLKAEKKILHTQLRAFEKNFQKREGRKVGTAKDIIPVEAEYYRYKQVKAELEKIQEGNKKRPLHPRAAEAKS